MSLFALTPSDITEVIITLVIASLTLLKESEEWDVAKTDGGGDDDDDDDDDDNGDDGGASVRARFGFDSFRT
jgi:hypothetical protein